MSAYDDYDSYREEEGMQAFLDEELQRIAEDPVIVYLAVHGDAIEARVKRCLDQAHDLRESGYHGAALTRAASGIEVTIRFFLARPLVQGAFLSEDWADLLSQKMFSDRTAEDRKMLPAILRNWKIDITRVKLQDGSQAWEQIVTRVWPRRNDYVHKADDASAEDSLLAIECLTALLSQVVDPIAIRFGFTREQTGCWSVVSAKNPPEIPNLNPPRKFPRLDPFVA
jgi:hypothetical protein